MVPVNKFDGSCVLSRVFTRVSEDTSFEASLFLRCSGRSPSCLLECGSIMPVCRQYHPKQIGLNTAHPYVICGNPACGVDISIHKDHLKYCHCSLVRQEDSHFRCTLELKVVLGGLNLTDISIYSTHVGTGHLDSDPQLLRRMSEVRLFSSTTTANNTLSQLSTFCLTDSTTAYVQVVRMEVTDGFRTKTTAQAFKSAHTRNREKQAPTDDSDVCNRFTTQQVWLVL